MASFETSSKNPFGAFRHEFTLSEDSISVELLEPSVRSRATQIETAKCKINI